MAKIKKKLKPFKNCDHKAQSYCFNKGFVITLEPSGVNYKVKYQRGHNGTVLYARERNLIYKMHINQFGIYTPRFITTINKKKMNGDRNS